MDCSTNPWADDRVVRRGGLGVADALFDEGPQAEPRLDLDRVTHEVGHDEAVGVGDVGLAVLQEAELVRVDGPAPPGPGVSPQILSGHLHPPGDAPGSLRPALGHVGTGSHLGVHVLGRLPVLFGDGSGGPPDRPVALRRDSEVGVVGQSGLGHLLVEQPRVGPHDRAPESLRQGGRGSGDERWGLGTGVASPRAELRREHEAGLGPDGRMWSADPLAPIVEGHALLLRPVGLDVGRVEIDGRTAGGQGLPAGSGHQLEPPPVERTHRRLEAREDRVVEALGPTDERGGRRDRRHGPQWGAGVVLAGEVEIDHEVPAREHRLGHRHHELAHREPPPAGLEPHVAIEGGADRHDAIEFGDEVEAGVWGEGRVRLTKRDDRAIPAYRVHLTGAFLPGDIVCSQPPFSQVKGTLSRMENRCSRPNSRIQV